MCNLESSKYHFHKNADVYMLGWYTYTQRGYNWTHEQMYKYLKNKMFQGLERHLLGTHGLVTASMQDLATKGQDSGRCPICGKVRHLSLYMCVCVCVCVIFFSIGQPSFPRKFRSNRISPYPSVLGRSHCVCWPQSLSES